MKVLFISSTEGCKVASPKLRTMECNFFMKSQHEFTLLPEGCVVSPFSWEGFVIVSKYSSDIGGPTMVGAYKAAENFENLPL